MVTLKQTEDRVAAVEEAVEHEEKNEIENQSSGEHRKGDVQDKEPSSPGGEAWCRNGFAADLFRGPESHGDTEPNNAGPVTKAGMPRLVWDTYDAPHWRKHMNAGEWSTLEQSWVFGEAVATTNRARVRRAVLRDEHDRPQAIVQAIEKPVGRLMRIVRIVRGPLPLGGSTTAESEPAFGLIRRAFSQRRRFFLFWLPELSQNTTSHALMRSCGTRRVVTGYSTIRLDLRKDLEMLRADMHGKWRNALRAAERGSLRVKLSSGGPALDRLLVEYDLLQRRKGFAGHSSKLLKAFADNCAGVKDVTVVSARQGSDTIGAALFLRHGRTATYTAAWSSDEGRAAKAPNLLLWRGIEALHGQGLAWLDLGGVNTTRTPGLARFKLGLGGEVFTLTGTYL